MTNGAQRVRARVFSRDMKGSRSASLPSSTAPISVGSLLALMPGHAFVQTSSHLRPGAKARSLLNSTALIPAITAFATAGAILLPTAAKAQSNVTVGGGTTLTVRGDNTGDQPSPLAANRLIVGTSAGPGTVIIETGGRINVADRTQIGQNGGTTGTVTVDGSGSSLVVAGDFLEIGFSGSGNLSVTNGGTVSSGRFIGLGTLEFASGRASVSGAGSNLTSDAMFVGEFGNGELTVADGGSVSVDVLLQIASFAGSVGTLNIGAAAGSPAAAPGTITAPRIEFGQGNGRIVFNHTASDYVFTNAVSGPGAFDHLAGVTILTGNNTNTGLTRILAGTLVIGDGGTTGSLGSGNVENNSQLVFDRFDNITVGNLISGTGSLTQRGLGVLTLTGANTYSGTTLVSGGTLQVGNGGTTGALGTGGIVNNATLIFNRSDDVVLANSLSGAGNLVKQGAGRLTLAGPTGTAYSGEITISAGTLQIGNGEAAGTTFTGNIVNNAALAFNRSGDLNIGRVISGTGSLTQLGSGKLRLSGANTYTGDTRVQSGTLELAGGRALADTGRLIIDAGAVVEILVSDETIGSLEGAGDIIFRLASLVVGDSSSTTFSGRLLSGGGASNLTKVGSGTLTLSGANTYNGQTSVNAGTLRVASATALGTSASGPADGTIVANGATLEVNLGAGAILNEAITINGTGVNNAGALSFTNSVGNRMQGAITLGSDSLIRSSVGRVDLFGPINGSGQTLTFNVGASGVMGVNGGIATGSGGLVKNGFGFLALFSATSFTGGITINEGTLFTSAGGAAINDSVLVTLNSPGVLLIGGSERIGNITGNGSLLIGVGNTLTLGDATNQTFSGRIGANGVGATGLVKEGTGTLTLTGASDYTGTTEVAAGILRVNGSLGGTINVTGGTLGGTGTLGAVTIGNGGTLAAGQSAGTMTVGALTLNAGSLTIFELAQAGVAGGANNDLIRVTGALTLNGGNIDIVQGVGFSNGRYTLFEFGTLAGALGNLTLNPLGGGFVGTLALDGTSVILNAAPPEDLIFWNGTTTSPTGAVVGGSGIWNFTNANFTEDDGDFSGVWAGNGFNAVFAGTGGTVTIAADTTVAPSGLAFLVDGYTITGGNAASRLALTGATGVDTSAGVGATIAAVISGSGSLTKTGDGTLTLSGVNTYTGNTTVMGGTLVNSGTLASAVTNMADFTSTGMLLATFINNAGASAELSGNAAQVNNFGTLNISGDLTGNAGLSNGQAGVVSVGAGTTVNIAGLVSNNSTAAEAFTINGSLSTASQFDNNNGAQLLIGSTGTLSTGTGLNNAGTIVNNGTINSIVRNGGILSTTGTITQELVNQAGATATVSGDVAQLSNSGTLTLTGTTTGSARLDNFASGLVTVNAGASASFAGDIFNGGTAANAFTINGSFSSGGLFINQSGANLLIGATGTLGGANGITNAGGTIVNNGTITSILNNFGTLTSTGTLQNGLLNGSSNAIANLQGSVQGAISSNGTINLTGTTTGIGAVTQQFFGVFNLGGFDTSFGSLSGLGSVNMGTATLTVGSDGTSTTFGGVIRGDGGVVKTGAGTLTLSGTNTYLGETRIDGGGISLASSGVIAGRVRNSGVFTNAGTVNGSVVNLGSLTSTGTVQGGLTQFTGSSATLSGTLNGEIRNGGALTVNGNLVSDNFAQTSDNSTTQILSGARWSGLRGFSNLSTNADGLVISGTLDVSGIVGNFPGATMTINSGGTLTAQNMANLGRTNNNGTVNTDITNSGTIDNNGTWNGGLSQGTGTVTSNAQWNGFFLVDAGGLVTNNGTWANNSGFLSAVRNGTFENFGMLTGGGISVSGASALLANRAGGTMTLGTGQFLFVSDDGIISNAGTISAGAQILAGGVAQNSASGVWTGSFSVAATGSLINTGTITTPGSLLNRGTFVSNGTFNGLLVNEEGANATLAGIVNGNIANSGQISLVGSTFGIRTLEQNSTGAFDMGGFDTTIGALQGNGLVLLRDGDLTLNAATGTNTYVGEITGTGGLIKTGAATQIFTGDLAYTGETEILGGTLVIADGSLAGSVRNTANFILDGRLFGDLNNVGTMLIAGQVDGNTLNNGTITNIGNSIFLGRFEQSASMGTSLNLAGFNTRLGSLNGAGTVNLGTAVLTVGSDNTSARYTGTIAGEGALLKIGTGSFALGGVNTFTGPTVINGGSIELGSDAALAGAVENNATFINRGRVAGLVVNNGSLTSTGRLEGGLFNAAGATALVSNVVMGAVDNAGLITLTGGTRGIGLFTQAGTGFFDLADFDTSVQILSGSGSVTLGSATLTVTEGDFSRVFSGVISGSGGVTMTGGRTLRLSGVNTYTGLTTVESGTLLLDNGGVIAGSVLVNGTLLSGGTIGGDVVNNGTMLSFDRIRGSVTNNGSAELNGQIDGPIFNNGVVVSGSGGTFLGRFTQIAGASATFSGFNSRLGSLAGDGSIVINAAFLNVGSDNTSSTFAGVISGDGGLVKLGDGTFTLSGVNTYAGTTFVTAGTLVVGDGETMAPPPSPTSVSAPESARVLLQGDSVVSNGRIAVALNASPAALASPEAAPMAPTATTLSGAVISGNVVNDAVLINNGTILGQVVNNDGASATNHGVIEGAVLNDGTLVSTGTLGGGLANNGTALIRGILDGTVLNTGSVRLSGITTGIDVLEQTDSGIFNLAGFDTTIGVISGAGSITLGGATMTTGTDGIASLFSGVISGPGRLDKVGTGRLVLTGTNTYTGGTTISGGALQLGDGGAGGSIIGPVLNNGTLLVNRSDAYTIAGPISGTGMFVQDGTGTTTLTGANSYTGGTLVSRGRLIGNTTSLNGQIQVNAALEFAQATSGLFAGQLFGAGLFDKTGAGLLLMSGNSSGFTGGTFVRAGELRVTGSLANSRVTVLSGATLSGNGVIGGLVANSGSTVAPGANDAGVLGVNGAVTLAAGSTLQLQIRANGDSDALVATGAAQLGGTAAFTNLGGTYDFNSEFVLLQAGGGRTGTFNATTGFAGFGILYRPELVYSATQVRLRMAPNLLANIVGNTPLTANQRSVVNRIDGAVTAGYNPQPLFNVYALPTAQLPNAFDQLSGEVYATAAGVGIEQERLLREAVLGRAGAVAMAARAAPEAGQGAGVWGQLFGGWGNGDGDGNASSFDSDRAGFVTGIDFGGASESGGWRAGVFGMHITSDVTITRLGSSAQVEQSGGGAYASLSTGGLAAVIGGYLTSVDLTGSRNIALPGFNATLASDTGGDARQGFAELSYSIPAGEGTVRPFVAGAIGSFKLDALTERGGAASLDMARQSYSTGSVTAGVDGMMPVGKGMTLSAALAGRAQLGDRDPQAQLALSAAPQQAFAVSGVQLDKLALAARFDAAVKLGKNVDLTIGYTGLIGSTITDHGARATLNVQF